MKVRVYRNLRTGGYSILDPKTGRVIAHRRQVALHNVEFVVRKAGRARVLRERRKSVHAFAVGEWVQRGLKQNNATCGTFVRYNPYESGYFKTLIGQKVTWAAAAFMDKDGLRVFWPSVRRW